MLGWLSHVIALQYIVQIRQNNTTGVFFSGGYTPNVVDILFRVLFMVYHVSLKRIARWPLRPIRLDFSGRGEGKLSLWIALLCGSMPKKYQGDNQPMGDMYTYLMYKYMCMTIINLDHTNIGYMTNLRLDHTHKWHMTNLNLDLTQVLYAETHSLCILSRFF